VGHLWNPGLVWVEGSPLHAYALKLALDRWYGTPYNASCIEQKIGVYCTAFVVRVLDEVLGREETRMPEEIPHDASFHCPETARAGLRWFLRAFPQHERVEDGRVRPGDVLVTGPLCGGPGHALIVGPQPGTMWQATACGVHFTGLSIPRTCELHAIYRVLHP
jgi:hypothetical protein